MPASPPPVVDEPIIAFADPYNNQNANSTGIFDFWHCLYQLDVLTTTTHVFPLMIVRSAEICGASDTRIALNQDPGDATKTPPIPATLLKDPINNWYVGAVNQMGIHVHWRAIDLASGQPAHFYTRDMNRTFDEDIDENTLVTDYCTINDGTSHGGTVGASIITTHRMSIWTDPNYGADPANLNAGLYQAPPVLSFALDPHVGTLHFSGENVVLTVGDLNPPGSPSITSATFAIMPHVYVDFEWDKTTQKILVNSASVFDYYGLEALHGSIGWLSSPFTGGAVYTNGAGLIDLEGWCLMNDSPPFGCVPHPAFLKIHGGAEFMTEDNTRVVSNGGEVDILYEPAIYPQTSGGYNPSKTGHITQRGNSTFTDSWIYSNIPDDNTIETWAVLHGTETSLQLDVESSTINNLNLHGASETLIKYDIKPIWGVKYDHSTITASKIHVYKVQTDMIPEASDVTITNCQFNAIHGKAIYIENPLAPTGLDQNVYDADILISHNNFTYIDSHMDPDDATHGTYGIYIRGIDGNWDGRYDGDMQGKIQVDNNTFVHNDWPSVYPNYPSTPNNQYMAAICFENTTGNIKSNNIRDPAFTKGIWLRATEYSGSTPQSRSLLCSNIIRNLHPTDQGSAHSQLDGILAEYYIGYTKLNQIKNCEVGIDATGHGNPQLVFNTIDNSLPATPTYDLKETLHVIGSALGNVVEMEGVHGGGNDYGGFNTLKATYADWQTGLVTIGNNAQLELGNNLATFTWSEFGQNNLFLCVPGAGTVPCQPTDDDAYILKGLTSSPVALGDIDFNFWGLDGSSTKIDPANGTGVDPHNWNAFQATQVNAFNISHNLPANTLAGAASGDAFCTSDVVAHSGGPKPLSMPVEPDACTMSFNRGHAFLQAGQWRTAYDTIKDFITRCPFHFRVPFAFGEMYAAVQNGADGPSPECWENFRSWLLKALAWNRDKTYFCAIVEAIAGTFSSPYDTTFTQGSAATNKSLAVTQWLIENDPCHDDELRDLYVNTRGSQRAGWFNEDTSVVKLDTTLPSMHDLGLDSVLMYAGMVGVHSERAPDPMLNALASPNPVGQGTLVSFSTKREAYVKIEVYDLLGNTIHGGDFGRVIEAGKHQIPIDTRAWVRGTYYARISSSTGESATVKLVKE
jgi:hypothetical protein